MSCRVRVFVFAQSLGMRPPLSCSTTRQSIFSRFSMSAAVRCQFSRILSLTQRCGSVADMSDGDDELEDTPSPRKAVLEVGGQAVDESGTGDIPEVIARPTSKWHSLPS